MTSQSAALPGTSATSAKRLPPNPRRRKIPPEQRKRVARACNACNVRRIKCSGTLPCFQCASGSRICEYPSEKRKLTIPEETYVELQERCMTLQRCLEDAVPSETKRNELLSKWTNAPGIPADSPVTTASQDYEDQETAWKGRILQDPDGYVRYMGEPSGAAFMDRLREFVSTIFPLLSDRTGIPTVENMFTSLLGRYHTHDSKPLILPDVDLFYLPPHDELARLFSVFQFYAQNEAASASGGIYYWSDLSELESYALRYEQISELNSNDSRMLANLNIIMALACQFDPTLAPSWEAHPGLTYFARAKLLLISPIEDSNLINMRILGLMGQYLLGIYRRDAAYLYIGLAGRTAIIYGLHKGYMIDDQGETGEKNKRQFWNTYIIDRWLSCLMGRPPMIPEEAVDVRMPTDFPGSNVPPASGLRAHIELSRIMDEIVNKVYGDERARVISEMVPRIHNLMQKLSAWLDKLPPSLQFHGNTNPDRACLMLHMMYNQLKILCTRPLLFIAAKRAVATKYIAVENDRSPDLYSVEAKYCTEAARQNSILNRQLLTSNQTTVFATLDYHYAFTAAIILQLTRLISYTGITGDSDITRSLEDYLHRVGDGGNESAKDCYRMVVQLGAVVSRLLSSEKMQITASERLTDPSTDRLATSIQERSIYPPIQGRPTYTEDVRGIAPSVSSNIPLQDQPTVYQELFSWFEEATF
ncbi:fungal-specific transcription factor domain-containing protein [Xylogone sp. PMI_703]|nr:fungal-specific transcription factor domain-containing protein [Xylogone sp. PMI_703]